MLPTQFSQGHVESVHKERSGRQKAKVCVSSFYIIDLIMYTGQLKGRYQK